MTKKSLVVALVIFSFGWSFGNMSANIKEPETASRYQDNIGNFSGKHWEPSTSTNPKGWRGWNPTFHKDIVTLYFNWTKEKPIPCGKHKNAVGCSRPIKNNPICKISIHPFEKEPTMMELAILGHETLHCIKGAWHHYE